MNIEHLRHYTGFHGKMLLDAASLVCVLWKKMANKNLDTYKSRNPEINKSRNQEMNKSEGG